jgi:hypothetical protein
MAQTLLEKLRAERNQNQAQTNELTMLDSLGTSLSQSLSSATTDEGKFVSPIKSTGIGQTLENFAGGAIESASFGFADGSRLGIDANRNSNAYALGNLAGFFTPYVGVGKLGLMGIKGLGKAAKGTALGKTKILKQINATDNIKDIATGALTRGGVTIMKGSEKISAEKFINEVAASDDLFKAVNNFDDTRRAGFYGKRFGPEEVQKKFNDGIGNYLEKVGKDLGYTFGRATKDKSGRIVNSVVEEINKKASKYWSEGFKPINTLPDLLTEFNPLRKLGMKEYSKADIWFGHAAEDVLYYTMVEGAWMASRNIRGEENPYTGKQMLAEALLFGPAAASVRFIPGGLAKGPLSIMNKEARDTIASLMKNNGNYYKGTNVKGTTKVAQKSREDVTSAYMLYARMHQPAVLHAMEQAGKLLPKEMDTLLKGKKNPHDLKQLVIRGAQEGATEIDIKRAEAAAEYMKLSLNGVAKSVNINAARMDYGKLILQDFAQTKFRQGAGAFILGMAGASPYFFGQSIDEDNWKMTAVLGYFLFKRGHKMTYKGRPLRDGTSEWTTTTTPWEEKIGDRFQHIKEQVQLGDAIGVHIDHPIYNHIRRQLISNNATAGIEGMRMAGIDENSPTANTIRGMIQNDYLKDVGGKEKKIKKDERDKVNAIEDVDNLRSLYQDFIMLYDNVNFTTKKTTFKTFDELTADQVQLFSDTMKGLDVRPDNPRDLIVTYAKPVIENFKGTIEEMENQILDIYNKLPDAYKPVKTRSKEYGNDQFVLKRIGKGAELDLDDFEGEALFTELTRAVDYVIKYGTGKIKASGANKVSIKNSDLTDKGEFLSSIKSLLDGGAELFSSNNNLPKGKLSFNNEFMYHIGDMMQSLDNSERLVKFVDNVLNDDKFGSQHSKIRTKIEEIFAEDGIYKYLESHVDISKLSKQNQNFVKSLLPLLRKQGADDLVKQTKRKKLTNAQVNELRELFVEQDFGIFSRMKDRPNIPFLTFIGDLEWKNQWIKYQRYNVDGNLQSYTNVDRAILETFEEFSLIKGRSSNTIHMDIRILADLDISQHQKGVNFLKFLEDYESGESKKFLTSFINTIKSDNNLSASQADKAAKQLIMEVQEIIKPYILKTENGITTGHLTEVTDSSLYFKDINTLNSLKKSIEKIKTIKYNDNMNMFAQSLKKQVKDLEADNIDTIGKILKYIENSDDKFRKFYNHLNTAGFLSNERKLRSWKEMQKIDDSISSEKIYQDKMKQLFAEQERNIIDDMMAPKDKEEMLLDFDLNHSRELSESPNTISKLLIEYGEDSIIIGKHFKKAKDAVNIKEYLDAKYSVMKDDGRFVDNNGNRTHTKVFLQRLRENIIETNPLVDVEKLNQELIAIGANLENRVVLKTVTYDGSRGFSNYEDFQYQENLLLKSLRGIFEDGTLADKIVIMNNNGFANNVYRANRTLDDNEFFYQIANDLATGNHRFKSNRALKKGIDEEFDENDIDLESFKGILIRLNEKTNIVIRINDTNKKAGIDALDEIADRYVKWRKKNLGKNALDGLQENFYIRKHEDTGKYIFDIDAVPKNPDGSISGKKITQLIQPMMMDLTYGKKAMEFGLGEKTWLALRNATDEEQFKSLKRFKLHDNKSAKNIDSDQLRQIGEFIKDTKDPTLNKVATTINKVVNGDYKFVIVEDELPDGTINDMFSQRKRDIKQYKDEFNIDIEKELSDTEYNALSARDQRIYDAGRERLRQEDVSILDAASMKPTDLYDLEAMLLGTPLNQTSELSGVKYIGHKDVGDEIALMKTAGLHIPNQGAKNFPQEMMTAANQQNIIFIARSGVKDLVKGINSDLTSRIFSPNTAKDFNRTFDDTNSFQFNMNDISLLSSKGKKSGALPPNLTGFLTFAENGDEALNAFVSYNYTQNIRPYNTKAKNMNNSDRTGAIEDFLYLTEQNSNKLNADTNLRDSQPGVLQSLAKEGVDPYLFYDKYFDMFADEYVLNAKVKHGNNAVIQPDITGSLKSMIADETGVIRYGETTESYYAGQTEIDVDNFAIILKDKNDVDRLVHITELKDVMRDQELRKGLTPSSVKKLDDLVRNKPKKGSTLKDLVDYFEVVDDVQVASLTYRNPITRLGSVIIEGIKDIGSISEKNKKVVASGDVIHMLKGDYDIDDTISMYSQPADVWKGFNNLLGKKMYTQDTLGSPDNYKGFSLTDSDKFAELQNSKLNEAVIKGTGMNFPEILRFLTATQSRTPGVGGKPFPTNGLVMQIGKNTYIRVKENIDPIIGAKVDEYNQKALDISTGGYNIEKLGSKTTIMNDLFFSKDGIFERVDGEGLKLADEFQPHEMFAVREYVNIFSTYLRDSGGEFSTGRKRSASPSRRVKVIDNYDKDLALAKQSIEAKMKKLILSQSAGQGQKAWDDLYKDLYELDFGGHNINSSFTMRLAGQVSSKAYENALNLKNVSPRDYQNVLLRSLYEQNTTANKLQIKDRLDYQGPEFETLAFQFMDDASEATENIIKGVKNYHDASIKLQAIEEQYFSDLDKLKELQAGKKLEYGEDDFSGDALIKYYSSRTKGFDKKYSELKQEINNKLFKDLDENIKKELVARIKKIYDKHGKLSDKKLGELVNEKMKDFITEPRKYEETLSEFVGRSTAGVLNQRIASSGLQITEAQSKLIDNFVSQYKKEFYETTNGTSKLYGFQDYDSLQYDFDRQLYLIIQENGLADKIDIVLSRIMSPDIDIKSGKFVEFNGKYLFVSDDKSLSKRINLAIRFNNSHRVDIFNQKTEALQFNKDLAKTSRDVVDVLNGKKPNLESVVSDKVFIRNQEAFRAFTEYGNTHNDSVLRMTNILQDEINQSGMSRLSYYEQFYIGIGTGLYRSVARKGGLVGDSLIAHEFAGRGDYRVNGIAAIYEAIDKGVYVFEDVNSGLIPSDKPFVNRTKSNFMEWNEARYERIGKKCVKARGK